MKKIGMFIFLIVFISTFGYPEEFKFLNQIGRKYRIKNLIRQDVYLNGVLNRSIEAMNKSLLELVSISNQYGFYNGKYEYFEKNINLNESFKLENTYKSQFYQDDRGRMIIEPDILMPVLRNVPTFPTNDLKPGDSWKAEGEELHEGILERTHITRMRFPVNYVYLGNESINNVLYARFSINYHIIHYPKNDPDILSITGFAHSTYYWDISNRCPAFYDEEYSFLYNLKSGENVLYTGQSEGKCELVSDVTNEQKQQIISEMSNKIKNTQGLSIKDVADGIILNLGNILFDFNKYSLKKEFENKLSSIAEVLRKYPQIDMVVSGHTDNIGNDNYNQVLSENRAKTVADYLIKNGINPTRISYIGYGSKKPIASNETEEGRSQNRRVEIKLITKE